MTTATTPEQADAIVNKAAVIAYKPIGLVFSVLGGMLANIVFGQVWKRISDAPTPPGPHVRSPRRRCSTCRPTAG